MKIQIQTTKDKIEISRYFNNEFRNLEVNEKLSNIEIEFDNDSERDQFIEKFLPEFSCIECEKLIGVNDKRYCQECYDDLDHENDILEEKCDSLLNKVENLKKCIKQLEGKK